MVFNTITWLENPLRPGLAYLLDPLFDHAAPISLHSTHIGDFSILNHARLVSLSVLFAWKGLEPHLSFLCSADRQHSMGFSQFCMFMTLFKDIRKMSPSRAKNIFIYCASELKIMSSPGVQFEQACLQAVT